MSANIKASTDGTQAIIGVGGVDQMTVSNAGVVTANSFVGETSNTNVTATGSNTARSLQDRFADVVNVKDFGAVGDYNPITGIGTDDTVAIQNALNSGASKLNGKSGEIYLCGSLSIPSGIMLDDLHIKSNSIGTKPTYLTLKGQSAADRLLSLQAYNPNTITISGGDFLLADNNFTLEGFIFNDQGEIQLSGDISLISCSFYNSGIVGTDKSRISTTDLIITDYTGYGIELRNATMYCPDYIGIKLGRAASVRYNSTLNAERCQIFDVGFGFYLFFAGQVILKNGTIDTHSSAALINNYGGDFFAENISISNGTAPAIVIESNGSCYAENGTITNGTIGVNAVSGGFIQSRGMVFRGLTEYVGKINADGYIDMSNVDIDLSNTFPVKVLSEGTGLINIGEPGVSAGLTTLSSTDFAPRWNSVRRGNAFLGDVNSPIIQARSNEIDVNILDNSVYNINFETSVTAGIVIISTNVSSAPKSILAFRAASGSYVQNIASANTIATANIILTGTTGVDGAITVSATDKKLQIENRYGQTVKFYINVLQREDAYFAI